MNQDDFRQMLLRRGGGKDVDQSRYGGKRNLSEKHLAEVKKLLTKKSRKKVKKGKNAMPSDAAGAIDDLQPSSEYRDRAAERRSGQTGDMIDTKQFNSLDTKPSQLLDRDMAHTHLVKGLDYALLGQLKREKQNLLAEKQKLESKIGDDRMKTLKPHDGTMTFKTGLGRLVYYHACQNTLESTTLGKSELFLPGRMYYTYNLSTAEADSVPVSIQRSKEDCPEPAEVVSGLVDESIIDRVAEIMVNNTSGKKNPPKKLAYHLHCNKPTTAGRVELTGTDDPMFETKVAIDNDNEDIFPDMGPYIPIDQRMDSTSFERKEKEAMKTTGYFENLSAAITEKEDAARRKEEGCEQAWKDALQKAVKTQQMVMREKERRKKEAKMTREADDYAEYQDICALGGDSDDEDDKETARRRKAAGLGKMESNPNEKARRKEQKRKSKFANDFEKISKIMIDKSSKP